MPVSHIGLTVSHLPSSCSFFLSALQPLGYRYIGQQEGQIGLGIEDADFFLCQESPGLKAGAAHIAFSASSRAAVRDFYAAALNAGGQPHGAPAVRNEDHGYFNAAVLDFDGNSIEVVCREDVPSSGSGPVIERSRVLTVREKVTERFADNASVASGGSIRSVAKTASVRGSAVAPRSVAPSVVPKSVAPTGSRSVSAPVVSTSKANKSFAGDNPAKTLVGTLIGAAAGAAVVYAMCKSENESAKAEAAAYEASQAQAQRKAPTESPLKSEIGLLADRGYNSAGETSSGIDNPVQFLQRAIEAAPAMSYHSPTYTSVPASAVSKPQAIEWQPASEAGSGVFPLAQRSVSIPVNQQAYHDDDYLPYAFERRKSDNSDFLQQAGKSKRSSHMNSSASSHHSKAPSAYSSRTGTKSNHSRSSSQPPSQISARPSYASRAPSAAGVPIPASVVGSTTIGTVLGRSVSDHPRIINDDDDDIETVTPSDSISCVAHSERSRRSGKSSKSKTSKHSTKSKSRLSSSHSQADSDASTIKPAKLDNGRNAGSTMSLPIRGITPSVIEGKSSKRSVFSYAMA